jgi:hypothetical protein
MIKNFFSSISLKDNIIQIAVGLVLLLIFSFGNLRLIFLEKCCENFNFEFDHRFYFKPFLTEFFILILNDVLSTKGKIIFSEIILPLFTYIFLFKIFSKYSNNVWAACFCLVSLVSFQNIDFRYFLLDFFNFVPLNNLGLKEKILLIQKFPLPSLSILFFLVLFFYSSQIKNLTTKRISFFTFLWSVFFYINAIDAVFGFIFWYSYVFIRILTYKGIKIYVKIFLVKIIITLLVLSPSFLFWDSSVVLKLEPFKINFFEYQLIYMFLPISLIALTISVLNIDLRATIFKFLPVFLMMISEFLIIYFAYFFNLGVNVDILTKRIPFFFLHFLYYLPIIYFVLNSKEKNTNESLSYFKLSLPNILIFLINKTVFYFLILLSLFLIIFAYKTLVIGY